MWVSEGFLGDELRKYFKLVYKEIVSICIIMVYMMFCFERKFELK